MGTEVIDTTSENKPDNEDATSAVLMAVIGIVGALLGAIITIIGNYFVTYKAIEAPKISLDGRRVTIDEKKVSIEGHKLALALAPNISSDCSQVNIDQWTWKITCSSKNNGIYPVRVRINDVAIVGSTDTKEVFYKSGQGFSVDFPNGKDYFQAGVGGDGLLWLYINFDKNTFKDGMHRKDLVAKIMFNYKTIDSVSNYIIGQFPELKEIANDTAERYERLALDLTPPA